jgi:hypothetical protein
MTPKEKAKELVDKFINYSQQCINDEIINQFNLENPTHKGSKFSALMRFSEKYNAKQCALILLDEILDDDMYDMSEDLFEKRILYWENVKQEIKKL